MAAGGSPDGSTSPTTVAGSPGSSTPTTIGLEGVVDERGTCLTWDQSLGGAGTRRSEVVDCEAEHLFEVTSAYEIDGAPYGATGPSPDQWHDLMDTECRARATAHLGYELDPRGLYLPRAVLPTPQGWAAGDRTVVCGIGQNWTSSGPGNEATVPAFTGRVAGASQAWVFQVGTCLGGIDEAQVQSGKLGVAVTCAAPHTVEVVGLVDLSGLALDFPGDDLVAANAMAPCQQAAEAVYGGPLPDPRMASMLPLTPADWGQGQRQVMCTLAAVDAAGSVVLSPGPVRLGAP